MKGNILAGAGINTYTDLAILHADGNVPAAVRGPMASTDLLDLAPALDIIDGAGCCGAPERHPHPAQRP